jgi:hypothetical protein
MPKLRDLQYGVRLAVLGGDAPSIASAIRGDGIDPAARLAIYRTTVQATLREALEANFPVVSRLVDPRFFAYAVAEYLQTDPPQTAVLFEYGAGFPDFLSGFPPCTHLPYLADVARLEYAVNGALHAEDAQPIDPQVLGRLPAADSAGLRLRLHPSYRLVASPWPVDRIWGVNQPDAPAEATVDLSTGAARLEIFRRADQVVFRRLDAAAFAFLQAVAAGRCLESSTEIALAVDPFFDLLIALRSLLRDGLVVAFDIAPPRPAPQIKETKP